MMAVPPVTPVTDATHSVENSVKPHDPPSSIGNDNTGWATPFSKALRSECMTLPRNGLWLRTECRLASVRLEMANM